MKKIFTFVKDTIITGMLVIIPIAVIGVILSDVIKKLLKLTSPLSGKMSFAGPLVETIVAGVVMVLLLGAFLFICGILLKSYLGKSFENWLERIVLERIPFYKTIKGITRQVTGVEKGNYAVVEVDLYGNNTRVLDIPLREVTDIITKIGFQAHEVYGE